ncbi:hypothetical protein KU6B_16930 [Mameliella alba]|nr:hypothetical protein KU6B_16930 [Mameliella alba]
MIGITMGDPAGVGPEIILKAVAAMSPEERAQTRIFGCLTTLRAAEEAVHSGLDLDSDVAVTDIPVEGAPLPWGQADARGGDAAFRFMQAAVAAALTDEIGCIVTAPLNKAALNAAGHHYDGHTGMLAHLTDTPKAWMILASERLKVVHNSTHVSLRDAIDRATPEALLETIRVGNAHLKRLGYDAPRIAVAGSTRIVAKADFSGQRTTPRSFRRSRRRRPRASTWPARCPPIRCSTAPIRASSIWSSRSIMTRGISRSSWWPSTRR